jgi:arabinofuranosyltransferase
MMRQGLAYLVETLDLDPVTPLVLALGIAAPFALRAGRLVPLAAGAFLYVVYVVRIGGDFMMGRFLSAPFFLAAIVAARVIGAALDRQPLGVVPAVAALAVGLFATPRPTLKSDGSYVRPHPHYGERGIDDERAYYYPYTGLLRWAPGRNMLDEEEIAKYGRRVPPGGVAVLVAVGMSAWTAPRDAIIVDQLGITDPLTARLPFVGDWRPGHFNRGVPAGYVESLKQKKNVIADPAIAKLYDRIMKVVTGPLFTKERWGTMWGFWTERRR